MANITYVDKSQSLAYDASKFNAQDANEIKTVVNGKQDAITANALSKTNDTNVTLTLSGSPNTALLQAVGLTLGWTGTLSATRGGTGIGSYALGDIPVASATNILSALAGNTTTTKKFLTQTGNGTISASPAWNTIAASDVSSGAALSKTDDTNVTLTLGGSPTTALLSAASITVGWTGQLGLTRGGTNASLTASNGGIIYSTASAMAVLSGTATANQMLLSGASGAPSWSTVTHPATTTINQILYSSAANVISGLATANNGILITSGTGVPSIGSTLPSAVQSNITTVGTITSGVWTGTSIAIANGGTGQTTANAALNALLPTQTSNSGKVLTTDGTNTSWTTVSGGGTGITWTEVTATTQSASVNAGYYTNNASQVVVTLPSTAAAGSIVRIAGKGAGGWKVAQNSGQVIFFGNQTTTTGTTGYISSSFQYDTLELLCITANTSWIVLSVIGNPNVN